MIIDTILRMTQEKLFNTLRRKHAKKAIVEEDYFILVPGDAPVLLVSHLDTVHNKPVKTICRSDNGNILMSPEGIGGDDRCGVFALEKVYQLSKIKPWLLYTCDEEIGGHGAEMFSEMYKENFLPEDISRKISELKLIVEIDRKGHNDAVYYDCDCPELEKYISSKGYKTQYGTFSDISIIAPSLNIAAVNLSSGYHDAHTRHEYINLQQLEKTIKKVLEIVQESVADTFPVYVYKQKKHTWSYANFNRKSASKPWNIYPYSQSMFTDITSETIPKDLPDVYKDMYQSLLEIYTKSEMENLRNKYGNDVIAQLYEEEFGGGYYSAPYPELINF